MNKIVVIGARAGSKRIVNKNLRTINGVSLLHYTLDIATQLEYPIYMSSDSDEILNYAKNYKNTTIIKRPSELASDTATDLDWIKHLLKELDTLPEQLIFLRPTTPLRDINIVRNAINVFDPDRYTSLRSVHELSESSFKTFTIQQGVLKGFSDEYKDQPNHLVPLTFSGNGYVDILVTQQILENDSLYGNSIMPFITKPTVEIDTPYDLLYADWLIKEKR